MGARMTLSPHMAYCEVEVMKEMTFAQKALARAAGKEYVDTGEIINANVDVAGGRSVGQIKSGCYQRPLHPAL